MLTKLTNCILFFLLSLFFLEENRRGRGGDEGRDIKGGENVRSIRRSLSNLSKFKKTRRRHINGSKSYVTKADEKAEFKPAYDFIDIKPFSS